MIKLRPGSRSRVARRRQWPIAVTSLSVAAMLAAAGAPVQASAGADAAAAARGASPPAGSTADCDSLTTCYTPQQIQVAYGVKPLLDHGIDGRGETVVLPELAEPQLDPPIVTDMRQDMARFDSLFHLPPARMRVVTSLAPGSSPWLAYGEEVLDLEMVHALAPAASLVIVLVPANSLDSPADAAAAAVASLRLGSSLGGIMSVSLAGQVGGEHCITSAEASSVNAALQTAAARRVTVVAASDDTGAAEQLCTYPPGTNDPVKGVIMLASDPLVLGAGGTTLIASHQTGDWISETAWGLPYGTPGSDFQASGGGFSLRFPRPAYQDCVPGTRATRGVPDVSADANGHTGMALTLSEGDGKYMIRDSGGTSAAAPIWAAIIALADQYAGRDLGFVNPAIYSIASSPFYHLAFHDVTQGNNTVEFPPVTITGYRAAPGWDPVTGWGSPDAQVLVPLLARFAAR
jgi:subtilase family serine protease